MENANPKLEKAKKLVWDSFQNLQKNLAENEPKFCITAISILKGNLNVLEMAIKLEVVTKELNLIETDKEKLDEYFKLKNKIDSIRTISEQPF